MHRGHTIQTIITFLCQCRLPASSTEFRITSIIKVIRILVLKIRRGKKIIIRVHLKINNMHESCI